MKSERARQLQVKNERARKLHVTSERTRERTANEELIEVGSLRGVGHTRLRFLSLLTPGSRYVSMMCINMYQYLLNLTSYIVPLND